MRWPELFWLTCLLSNSWVTNAMLPLFVMMMLGNITCIIEYTGTGLWFSRISVRISFNVDYLFSLKYLTKKTLAHIVTFKWNDYVFWIESSFRHSRSTGKSSSPINVCAYQGTQILNIRRKSRYTLNRKSKLLNWR